MNTWVCIAWEDVVSESGKTFPTPVTKEVQVRPELTQAQILAAFKRKFPHLRNHTVHAAQEELAVIHRGPGDCPIAVKSNLPAVPTGEKPGATAGVCAVQCMPLPPRGHTLAECQPDNPRRDNLNTAALERITSPRSGPPPSNRQAYSPRSTHPQLPAAPTGSKTEAATSTA